MNANTNFSFSFTFDGKTPKISGSINQQDVKNDQQVVYRNRIVNNPNNIVYSKTYKVI